MPGVALMSPKELVGPHRPHSMVGRKTEENKRFMVRCMDPKEYRKEFEPDSLNPKERIRSVSPPKKWESPRGSQPYTACFANSSREQGSPGEKSRSFLRRTFHEFGKLHEAPAPGTYNPNHGLTVDKTLSTDFNIKPKTSRIMEKEDEYERPLSPAPVFGVDVGKGGPVERRPRPNLSLMSHRERHLKAETDTEDSWTGWTPCDQHAVEYRNPVWDFSTPLGRAKGSTSTPTFYLPGRYANGKGDLPSVDKPSVKQGRRFDYKTNSPMKRAETVMEDLSLSRIIPLVSPANSQTLWHRSKSQREELTNRSQSAPYKEEDADKVFEHQMQYNIAQSEMTVQPNKDLAPHWKNGIERQKGNYGHRNFNCDRAMRGSCGLIHEVSVPRQYLPIERTAECESVKPKVPCPNFKTGSGRTKSKSLHVNIRNHSEKKRMRKTDSQFRSRSASESEWRRQSPLPLTCASEGRRTFSGRTQPYLRSILPAEKHHTRSYEELSGWNEAVRAF